MTLYVTHAHNATQGNPVPACPQHSHNLTEEEVTDLTAITEPLNSDVSLNPHIIGIKSTVS